MSGEPKPPSPSLTQQNPADEFLITRTLKGDNAAFDDLIKRYRDRVVSLVFHILGNFTEAEDLAQDVFVRAYRGLRRFRGQSSFFTWLYRIAVNVAYTSARKSSRRRFLQGLAIREARLRPAPKTPEEEAVSGETELQVHAAMARIDPRLRAVLVLKEMEGMEVGAVAEILKIPVGTVKSRLFRAREDLRGILIKEAARRPGRPIQP